MCIFKGIVRYRTEKYNYKCVFGIPCSKILQKNAPYNKGGSLPLIAAPAPPSLTLPLRAGFMRQPATPGFKFSLQSILHTTSSSNINYKNSLLPHNKQESSLCKSYRAKSHFRPKIPSFRHFLCRIRPRNDILSKSNYTLM